MQRFKRILHVTSGTGDEAYCVTQALRLARGNSAELCTLVIGPMLPDGLLEYEARYEASLMDRVNGFIGDAASSLKMSPDEIHATVALDCGDTPAVRIVRRVLRDRHDLVMKHAPPTERHAGFRAMDMQLLRMCPCPVWLCRPAERSPGDRHVAVAIDPLSAGSLGKDLALRSLQLSRSVADMFSKELIVISCWESEFEEFLQHSPWVRVADEAIRASAITAEHEHRAALEGLVQESGISGQIRVHCIKGRADREIPRVIREMNIDTLVMGTVARTGIGGFAMGNTAENALAELSCSLIALKPGGFVSPLEER